MKKLSSLIFVTLLFPGLINIAVAQQDVQTLFDGDVVHGGFGGPMIKFDDIRGDLGVWVGGRGGWVINLDDYHALTLGGGGFGLTTNHRTPGEFEVQNGNGEDYFAATGYGGLLLEYTNRSYQLLHLTATGLIGAGGLTIRDRNFTDIDEDPNPFFVMEPGIHLELNVAHFFRIATGLNYRITSGIDKAGFRDSDFTGANASITLKFGFFR